MDGEDTEDLETAPICPDASTASSQHGARTPRSSSLAALLGSEQGPSWRFTPRSTVLTPLALGSAALAILLITAATSRGSESARFPDGEPSEVQGMSSTEGLGGGSADGVGAPSAEGPWFGALIQPFGGLFKSLPLGVPTVPTAGERCAFSRGRFRWGCGEDRPAAAPARTKGEGSFPLAGVNVGGWLCLEDWFFSGRSGRQVMSTDKKGQGICLPPNVHGSLDEPWPSEGVLVRRLNASLGPERTAQAFDAHRRTFIQERDFRDMAELGIRTVRVPLTWSAFADALRPVDEEAYGGHDPDQDSVVVPDPYYVGEAAQVTIPRDYLVMMLHIAKHHGLRLVFDVHNMPGGSSHGTYNGVYPLPPVFWSQKTKVGSKRMSLTEVGHLIAEKMVSWVEGLDESLLATVRGVTFMNEPAHMSAFKGHFLVEDEEVLGWVSEAADVFRRSSLPERGVRLYVNLVETAFRNSGCAFIQGAGCGFDEKVPAWWEEHFSAEERSSWAVMDLHHYDAFSAGQCDGRVSAGGAFKCGDPLETIQGVWHDPSPVRACTAAWAQSFASAFPHSLRSVSEFSGATHWDAREACSERRLVEAYISAQSELLSAHSIEAFFWTWRMPNGNNFQAAWSLKWILGREDDQGPRCEARRVIEDHELAA